MASVQTWNMFLVTVGGERNGPCGTLGCNPECDDRLDLRLAIDPPAPRGNFVHYDFLKLQYISHKMRHVSPLRVEALSCNNNITYVTL